MFVVAPYSAERRRAWDAFSDGSDDAWMWHLRGWFDYARAAAGDAFLGDASFLVERAGEIVAIAPCMVVRNASGAAVGLALGDQPVPWPALSGKLGARERAVVEQLVFAEYHAAARHRNVSQIEMFGPILARSFYRPPFPPANLPLRHGYHGTVFDTWVIDLMQPVETLWRDVRKGHKSAIKIGQKAFTIEHWVGTDAGDAFRSYQAVHALAAGRVTRHQSTFDAMHEWIRTGHGLLVGAREGDRWIGFVYILLDHRAAFYASACNRPDVPRERPVGHALIWEAILRCRELGIELLEIGLQTYAPPAAGAVPEKLVSISLFKRGFGGFPMPRYHARLDIAPEAGAA